MIFAVDHIVFAVTIADRSRFVSDLAGCGFRNEGLVLDFPEIGAASESMAFRGGGFVEFVHPRGDTASPPAVWFRDVPRVIGVGFASDRFASDAAWDGEAGAWVMDEDHVLPNGSTLNIRAAGPHHHLSDFYVFVMDRPDGRLQFPEVRAGPALKRITLAGQRSEWWRERLRRWLGLSRAGDSLEVGGVLLKFEPGLHPNVQVRPAFVLPAGVASPRDVGAAVDLFPDPTTK